MLTIRLGIQVELESLFVAAQGELPDVEQLCHAMPCLLIARQVAEREHFHHWELVFSELLGPAVEGLLVPQGIDLMVGNPPWIKVGWNDAALLAEFDPVLGVNGAKSADINRARPGSLAKHDRKINYRAVFEAGEGTAAFLNDRTLYPPLAGLQTNLYKNFIVRSWDLLGTEGIAGLLHPEGVFDDPKGGVFRECYYSRLRGHFQFKNELSLFPDVGHQMPFSLNIFGGLPGEVRFEAAFNLYHPATLEKCRLSAHPGKLLPGIKTDDGRWETAGHPDRLMLITQDVFGKLARLFEDVDTPTNQARLPQIHGQPILSVLEKIGRVETRLGSLSGSYVAAVMFDETYAQRDGIITRCERPTHQPTSAEEVVLSGPLSNVARPWSKTAQTRCAGKNDYDDVDLVCASNDYLPRTVYRGGNSAGDLTAFHGAIDEWPKPTLPGFWPIDQGALGAWEALCGENIRFYRFDRTLPGAITARQFAYFGHSEGAVVEAVQWLEKNKLARHDPEFREKFGDVRLVQEEPSLENLACLPRPLSSYFRHIHRRQCRPGNVRSLISTIVPPGCTHINPIISLSFINEPLCLIFEAACCSIIVDSIIRIGGKLDIYEGNLRVVPILQRFGPPLTFRLLRLVSATTHYAPLWERNFVDNIRADCWTYDDMRLTHEYELSWADLPAQWERGCALRSDFARRQALLEVDVLVAQALDLTLDELLTIYRVQFPVMRQYENADEYDVKGRRLANTVRKDAGGKELRAARERHDGASPLKVSWLIDDGNATVTRNFHPPFTKVHREDDYRRAWAAFAARLSIADAKG